MMKGWVSCLSTCLSSVGKNESPSFLVLCPAGYHLGARVLATPNLLVTE